MGWTGIYTDRPTKDIIVDELTFSGEQGSARVLEIRTKLNTSYVALQRTISTDSKSPNAGKTYVIGVVILHRRRNGEFVYKDMSETMGPCESQCPASILDRLSPVEDFTEPGDSRKWATDWRARCRAAIEKRSNTPPDGATIRFAEPIRFTNGDVVRAFTLHKQGRRVRFSVAGDGNAVYRISNWQKREFEVLT